MVGVGFAWASILSLPYALLSDSLPAANMGVYMGIFNFFVVIPQLLAASVLGVLLKIGFHDQPIYALAIDGVSLIVAGLCTLRVREPGTLSAPTGEAHGCKTFWRPVASVLITSLLLCGCGPAPQAPSPTVNPSAHKFIKLKITVEKSQVNRVEVFSDWTVSNLSCAPVVYPAGNNMVKQVDTPEMVKKVDHYYVASISTDRFLPDKCRWDNDGASVNFLHGHNLLSTTGINADVLQGKRIDKMTCLTTPFVKVGTCGPRSEETFYKREDKNAFNVSVELLN
jgi:hypothetical protein